MDGWNFDTISALIGLVIGAVGVRLLAAYEAWRGAKE